MSIAQAAADNKFIRGKGDWLFLDNDSNRVNQQITGKLILPEKKLRQWQLLLEMRKAWIEAMGASYFYTIAPTKGCVYPEFLPASIQISRDRCVNQIRNYLTNNGSSIQPIYPIEELSVAKERRQVYSKKDTHWNEFGAFIAYQALFERVASRRNIRVLSESDVIFEPCRINHSDLGTKIGSPEDDIFRTKINSKFSRIIFHNKVRTRGKVVVFENKKYRYLPKGVLFRDSFSNAMLRFMAESFSRLVVVWQPNIDFSILRREQPDIVISQQAERFIPKLPDDFRGETNEEIVAMKAAILQG